MLANDLKLRTILVADDNDDNRLMLSFLLQEEGWKVLEASDGQEALEKVLKEEPGVLILDNRMPELTGTEVYKILKNKDTKTAIILATAYGDLEELAESLGIQHFITKPFDIPELIDLIEAAYAARQ